MTNAAAALFVAFGAAVCFAAAWTPARPTIAGRLRATAVAGGVASLAAWAAAAASGAPGAWGAALVVGGAAVLAAGVARATLSAGASAGGAVVAGAAVPSALAAAIFVADPFIEWRREDASSESRATAFVAVSPLASIAAPGGGAGVDWLRSDWMYAGPQPGMGGLSVVGQYYPRSQATAPWLWALAAAAAGGGLCAAARPRR